MMSYTETRRNKKSCPRRRSMALQHGVIQARTWSEARPQNIGSKSVPKGPIQATPRPFLNIKTNPKLGHKHSKRPLWAVKHERPKACLPCPPFVLALITNWRVVPVGGTGATKLSHCFVIRPKLCLSDEEWAFDFRVIHYALLRRHAPQLLRP